MRYHALACDYDGTLARNGDVAAETLAALERLLASGRKLILVTGRELDELRSVFPHLELFRRVVAENGALLYDPATKEERLLSAPIPNEFVNALRQLGIVSAGHVIIATCRPHEDVVLAAIRDSGLELQTIFNRDAVMILPAGVNKATGLAAALESLGLTRHEVVGVGDAENDHAFLALCEFATAVGNALPALKERADWVTDGADGAGVGELIEELIRDDLESRDSQLTRHRLRWGSRIDGREVLIQPRGPNILITGPSGSGRSTAAMSLLERLIGEQYQFCIVDSEGDYEGMPGVVTLGRGGADRWRTKSLTSWPVQVRTSLSTCLVCRLPSVLRSSSNCCRD
jgi:hydroxymethylpyrimidine pyrophosphatase-like HAD family hydrolase